MSHKRRVTALERASGIRGADSGAMSPQRIEAALKAIGQDAPPVLPNQTGPEYLETVSTEALKALMALRGEAGQS